MLAISTGNDNDQASLSLSLSLSPILSSFWQPFFPGGPG